MRPLTFKLYTREYVEKVVILATNWWHYLSSVLSIKTGGLLCFTPVTRKRGKIKPTPTTFFWAQNFLLNKHKILFRWMILMISFGPIFWGTWRLSLETKEKAFPSRAFFIHHFDLSKLTRKFIWIQIWSECDIKLNL